MTPQNFAGAAPQCISPIRRPRSYGYFWQSRTGEIILIGHSLGGLIIKQLGGGL
jgi:hypothetical protein